MGSLSLPAMIVGDSVRIRQVDPENSAINDKTYVTGP
jgi:hypothetical protein